MGEGAIDACLRLVNESARSVTQRRQAKSIQPSIAGETMRKGQNVGFSKSRSRLEASGK